MDGNYGVLRSEDVNLFDLVTQNTECGESAAEVERASDKIMETTRTSILERFSVNKNGTVRAEFSSKGKS